MCHYHIWKGARLHMYLVHAQSPFRKKTTPGLFFFFWEPLGLTWDLNVLNPNPTRTLVPPLITGYPAGLLMPLECYLISGTIRTSHVLPKFSRRHNKRNLHKVWCAGSSRCSSFCPLKTWPFHPTSELGTDSLTPSWAFLSSLCAYLHLSFHPHCAYYFYSFRRCLLRVYRKSLRPSICSCGAAGCACRTALVTPLLFQWSSQSQGMGNSHDATRRKTLP